MRHARLQPSSAHRWMACPGSAAMEAASPRRGSAYADQGTACHVLLGLALAKRALPASVRLAGESPVEGFTDVEVTPAMRRWAEEAATWVRDYVAARPGAVLDLEVLSSVGAHFGVGNELFGHADVVVLSGRELTVVDAKFGYEEVQAAGNPQLGLYAVGLAHRERWRPSRYSLVVLQPRSAEPVKVETLSRVQLEARAEEYRPKVEAALRDDAPLVVGDQCRGCRAAGRCRAYQEWAQEEARRVFLPEPGPLRLLSPAELAEVLGRADAIRDALAAAEADALRLLALGEVVPGWKRVTGQGRRRWSDEAEAEKTMRALGLDPWRRTLLSPNQAEEELGARGGLLTALAPKVPGQPTLAPESDGRPALPPDFKKEPST